MRRLFSFQRKEDETLKGYLLCEDDEGGKNDLEKDGTPFFNKRRLPISCREQWDGLAILSQMRYQRH